MIVKAILYSVAVSIFGSSAFGGGTGIDACSDHAEGATDLE
jgi:hypothetical protein